MRIEKSICPLTVLVEEACLQCVSREASVRLQACRKEHAYTAYREEHLSAYNACRKEHAYKGIERSVNRGE